jgi:hypothetical protein
VNVVKGDWVSLYLPGFDFSLWLERTATPNREANTRPHFTSQLTPTRGALQLSQA